MIIPLVHFAGRKFEPARVKASRPRAGLLLAAAIPLARDALTDPVTVGIAVASFGIITRFT